MRFVVLKKKTLALLVATMLIGVIIVGAVLSFLYFNKDEQTQTFNSNRKLPIYRVNTEEKKVALTFDAAWGADKTEDILKILKKNNIKATFFLVGFWVDENPELVKKIDEYGMEIGTHSNTHPKMTELTTSKMDLEFKDSMSKIEKITGKKPTIFRAPFGDYNNSVLETAENNKLKTIQWDVDSLDWKGLSSKEITLRVSKNVKNGSIVLMHNNATNVLDGLTMTIDFLKGNGYSFCTVSELIYPSNYHILSNGEQVKDI